MKAVRKIVHIDMDAFYAAVEVLDNPTLKGKPVIVSGHPEGRGVVSSASYEARRSGVRSAMPISQAKRLCPHGIFLPARFERYDEISEKIYEILGNYTPLVEQVALDEWYLDVTQSERLFGEAAEIAKRIKAEIKERTGLTASAGVAPNKFLAKIASDLRKPDGLVVVGPEEVEDFLKNLPISRIPGVGQAMEKALKAMGIYTIGELAQRPEAELEARFGKWGEALYQLARGIDDEPVVSQTPAKSIGQEETFERDVDDVGFLRSVILDQCEQVARRARQAGYRGRTVCLKVRFSNFITITRSGTLPSPTDQAPNIYEEALRQLSRVDLEGRKVRLIGISLSGLSGAGVEEQLSLFSQREEKLRRATQALDEIWDRFGPRAIRRGRAGD